MEISCKPSNDGLAVLTSMMTLSAICTSSGDAPTEAPGMIPPSSVMAEASMTATSILFFGLFRVYQP